MTDHAVIIAGGGPTMMLGAELALAGVDAGGQGLNIGVQDAANLGWKLAQVLKGISSDALLDAYHAERHPVGARVLQNTMAQVALGRTDDRTGALRDLLSEVLTMSEPRKRIAGMITGLDVHYDPGEGHPLIGRRMPDLDVVTASGPLRAYSLLHRARPLVLNFGDPGSVDVTSWADRVQLLDARYDGVWELPVLGTVTAPAIVLIRPDGYVAWAGQSAGTGLADALTTWFGPGDAGHT